MSELIDWILWLVGVAFLLMGFYMDKRNVYEEDYGGSVCYGIAIGLFALSILFMWT